MSFVGKNDNRARHYRRYAMSQYDLDEQGFVKIELVDDWYVMLYECRHSGWVAAISTEKECHTAQSDEGNVVYCFRINRLKYDRLKLPSIESLMDMDCLSIINYSTDMAGKQNEVVVNLSKLKKEKLLEL